MEFDGRGAAALSWLITVCGMYVPRTEQRSRLLRRASLVGAALALGLGGAPQAAPPATTTPAAARPAVEFPAALAELRSALGQAVTLRKAASERGDKLKETCIYERQRALAQVVESAQAASVAWEAANARSDQNAARAEQARLVKALELGRQHREAAESCVGNDLAVRPRATSVTVDAPKIGDDPQAGPSESWTVRPARLELPSRPNPASVFRPSR